MTSPEVRVAASTPDLQRGLDRIRADLAVPLAFPVEVERAAAAAVERSGRLRSGQVDARDIDLVTIDPPGSRDLDQAYSAERTDAGFRVRYAIADVAALVASGDLVDLEARDRGVTIYLPDRRAGLYPEGIGEDAASLLPNAERPALLWTIDLDAEGTATSWRLEPALIRSREAFTYERVQRTVVDNAASESLMLLRDIGRLRRDLERRRGGVSISPPSQEVKRVRDHYELAFDAVLPAESWNAQVSLLAGMCAAATMADGGMGIVRTLPPPGEGVMRRLQRAAAALGVAWPEDQSYADVVRNLSADEPNHAAFLTQALEALRGAGYALVGAKEAEPVPMHWAIAAPYAHVTAPLRRLADRFANEIVLALCADRAPPSWASDSLPMLPDLMERADRRQKAVDRSVIDLVECLVLRVHVGDTFSGTVIDVDDDRAIVVLGAPPVIATLAVDDLELGEAVDVRVVAVDLDTRRVEFALP